MKLGNGTSTWTQITAYMNIVPDGNLTIGDYVAVNDIGASLGVVGLDSSKNALIPGSSIIVEGATDNSFETTLTVTDPTADRTITFKNADGTVAFVTDIPSNTDALTEGSTNKYFSDERAQDAVANSLAAGTHTNITVTYNDAANSLSLAAAPGYVDEQAVDAVAAALAAGTHTNISVSYNDAGNAISLTGAQTYNDENAQDAIGNNLGTGLSYNDTTGAISVDTSTIQARVANVTDTEIGYLDGVTSAIQAQINLKAPLASPTFTGTVSGVSATHVGLGNVDNTSDVNKPVSTATQTALDLKAPLASPALTGIPTAPTAISSTNTTQVATTAYVKSVVSDLTNGAGAAYDTLKELQDLIVADEGAVSSLTTLVGTKAPLASPTFTGTVSGIDKTMVGLGNVDNTTDAGKPVSTATQTALDLKLASATAASTYAPIASPTFTGTVSGITKTMVGLGNVENTALSTWAGSSSITTLGTIATGVWSGTAIATTKGGTGLTSYTTGDILYSSATNTLSRLSAGSNGQILTLASGVPTWAAAPITLPTQTSNSGKYLTTDGTTASWATIPVTSAATYNTLGTVYSRYDSTNNSLGFGNSVLQQSTGYGNAGLGVGAMWGNTSGYRNTGIGAFSLTTNATGFGNTAVGDSSLQDTTTSYGSALGSGALRYNTTGQANSAFGYNSLNVNTTGYSNSAFGTFSLINNISGYSNSAFGQNSLGLSTGNQNVAMGYESGLNLVSGNNNIIIGHNAQPSADTISNEITLGNSSITKLRIPGLGINWTSANTPGKVTSSTISLNTATTVDTVALAGFTSIEYLVSLKQGSKVRTSKVLVQTDGTSVDMTEFAITETGGTISGVVVSASVSSTNAILQVTATDATSTNVTVKFSKIAL
jgi:hypothetical protein